MTAWEIILGVLLIIASVCIIVFVMMQESREAGLSGAIAGGSGETFFGRNKSRTKEAQLSRMTKFVAIAFFVLIVATGLLLAYFK